MIESWCLELWTSQNGYTALIVAAECGHRDVVGLLLDRGADMEAKNNVSQQNSFRAAWGTTSRLIRKLWLCQPAAVASGIRCWSSVSGEGGSTLWLLNT